MGQQSNKQSPCNYFGKSITKNAQELVYYTKLEDRQFGMVSIYSSSRKPSSYVVKVQKIVQNSKIYNIFEHIQNFQLSSLASLHAFEVTRQKYFTGHIQQKITAYWQYYNYFFVDYIKMRFLKRISFTENEIWSIIKSCCQSYSLFNSQNLVLDLDLKHMTIIPQGKIKIYWHQVELKNQHLNFYKKIREKLNQKYSNKKLSDNRKFKYDQQLDNNFFFFSPQEIQGIDKREQTINIDFSKANSFRLGMIILYCITLTNPIKTCYGKNAEGDPHWIKIMVLNSLYESKVQNSSKYSQDLKHLIKLLLLEDPNKRIPITCLQNVYEKYLFQDTELMMGINNNPLYVQSSSRNHLKDPQNKKQVIKRKNSYLSQNHQNKNELSRKQSSKIIQQSRIRSSRHEVEQRNQSNHSGEIQKFDKFDTKTVKISSSYHKI